MAAVTSKSTSWPWATAPRVARAGPSITGRVFQLTVRSSHLQFVIGWMLPPETLWAFVTFATCSRRRAEEILRAPTPLTATRTKVRVAAGPASAESSALVPKLMAGRSDSTKVSAWTVATGAGATSVVVVDVVVDVESGAPPTSMTSCGFPAAASRALYRTPSAEGLSRAKQYTPSPRIVLVTSKSTAWPSATIPTVASTRPSMAGLVFQLTVRSFQLQLIGWMRPPATLWEFGRLATWSRRWADATWRPATPLTRTRRNVSFTGLASSSSTALVPKLMAGLAELTDASASTTATGAAAGHTGAPPPHLPPEQVSPAVQALPSSQAAPSGLAASEHCPLAGSQTPGSWH